MRILHTDFLRGWGGQPNRILVEAEECSKLGADVLIATASGSELATRCSRRGIPKDDSITFRGGLRYQHFCDFKRLRFLLQSFNPDIIHAHGGKDSWLLAEVLHAMPRQRRPLLVRTKHNIFPIKNHVFNRWLYRSFFDYLIAISDHIKNDLRNFGISDEHISVIPDSFDSENFSSRVLSHVEISDLRREVGFSDDDIVCITTARFEPEKGLSVLVDGAAIAVNENPRLRFLLVGDGRLRSAVEAQLKNLPQLDGKFHLIGFRNDVERWMKASDLAIIPSISEGLGTVSLEAGICGLPVLASKCGGLLDVVKAKITGDFFQTGSPTSLAEQLLNLTEDLSSLRKMGLHAQKQIQDSFSPTVLGKRTLDFYSCIMEKRL